MFSQLVYKSTRVMCNVNAPSTAFNETDTSAATDWLGQKPLPRVIGCREKCPTSLSFPLVQRGRVQRTTNKIGCRPSGWMQVSEIFRAK